MYLCRAGECGLRFWLGLRVGMWCIYGGGDICSSLVILCIICRVLIGVIGIRLIQCTCLGLIRLVRFGENRVWTGIFRAEFFSNVVVPLLGFFVFGRFVGLFVDENFCHFGKRGVLVGEVVVYRIVIILGLYERLCLWIAPLSCGRRTPGDWLRPFW